MSSRYYNTENGEYASVTTITGLVDKSDALMPWATRCMAEFLEDNWGEAKGRFHGVFEDVELNSRHDKIDAAWLEDFLKDARFHYKTVGKEARDVGSEVHGVIADNISLSYDSDGVSPPAWTALEAYKNWAKENPLHPVNIEQVIYNHKYGYAGTQDLKCVLDGVVSIVDWKTHGEDGKIHVPESPMQLSAYAKCEGNEDVEQIVVVGLNKVTGKHTEKRWGLEPDKKGECIDYFFGGFLGLLDNFFRFHAKKKLRRGVIDYGF